MFGMRTALLAAAAVLAPAAPCAAQYRILFQGSETMAMQVGGGGAPTQGYFAPSGAVPGQPGLPGQSAECADCVVGPSGRGAGTPNQIVTFLHPYTNKAITVPLTLPVGRPTIITRRDRIVYNYGLFRNRVVVKFLPNGQVEVIYRG